LREPLGKLLDQSDHDGEWYRRVRVAQC
jgi:hypothetical protein